MLVRETWCKATCQKLFLFMRDTSHVKNVKVNYRVLDSLGS